MQQLSEEQLKKTKKTKEPDQIRNKEDAMSKCKIID